MGRGGGFVLAICWCIAECLEGAADVAAQGGVVAQGAGHFGDTPLFGQGQVVVEALFPVRQAAQAPHNLGDLLNVVASDGGAGGQFAGEAVAQGVELVPALAQVGEDDIFGIEAVGDGIAGGGGFSGGCGRHGTTSFR